jgi:hypothetical protein
MKDTPPRLDRLVDMMNVANTTKSKSGYVKEFDFIDVRRIIHFLSISNARASIVLIPLNGLTVFD